MGDVRDGDCLFVWEVFLTGKFQRNFIIILKLWFYKVGMSGSCSYLVETQLLVIRKSCACLSKLEKNTVTRYTLRISAGVMSCFWPDVFTSISWFFTSRRPHSCSFSAFLSFLKHFTDRIPSRNTRPLLRRHPHPSWLEPLDETPLMNPKMSSCNHGDLLKIL